MYIEGEVPYVTGNNYGNNSGFGFGNGWEGLIGLALVAGLFGGWGNGSFGGGRGNCATQADLSAGFNNSAVLSNLNDIILGQAQMQNFINQGFNGIQNTLTTSFANLNTNLCSLGYNQAQLVNGLSREIADCCCSTKGAIADVKYANERNTCDIIRAGQDNTRAILDFLTSEKISSLQAENSGLKAQISNDRQTRTIIDEIKPCPIPAYITCNPYQSAYGFGNYGNNGCGCC